MLMLGGFQFSGKFTCDCHEPSKGPILRTSHQSLLLWLAPSWNVCAQVLPQNLYNIKALPLPNSFPLWHGFLPGWWRKLGQDGVNAPLPGHPVPLLPGSGWVTASQRDWCLEGPQALRLSQPKQFHVACGFWCEKLYIGDYCVAICQTLSFSAQKSQSLVYSQPITDAGYRHIHSHKHRYLQAETKSLRGLYGRYCLGIPLRAIDNIVSILQMRKRAQGD